MKLFGFTIIRTRLYETNMKNFRRLAETHKEVTASFDKEIAALLPYKYKYAGLKWKKHAKDLLVNGAENEPCVIGKGKTSALCYNGYFINAIDLFDYIPKEEE